MSLRERVLTELKERRLKVINGNIKDDVKLKNIITKSKYVILNTDVELEKEFWKDLNLTIISYGFNNKATFRID